jgi:4'-phosphopantetheinyl transferase
MRKPMIRWETQGVVFPADEEVHIWHAPLDVPPSTQWMLEQTLATDERARAGRYHRPQDRLHFVVGRGVLRTILAQYLRREPSALAFHYNRYGKPALTQEPGSNTAPLTFSVSHSRGQALYAVARDRPIGIDLEYVATDVEYEQVAEHLFSPREVAMLHALPTHLHREAVFTCWTRKEAYLKALGIGLSLPLSHFEVSVDPRAPATLLFTREQCQDVTSWWMEDLTLGSDYVAALAVQAECVQIRWWNYAFSPAF